MSRRAAIDAAVARLVAAARPGWPVSADHCFLRIAYDNAAGAKWDTLVRPPAWRNLPDEVLADALRLLGEMHDPATLRRLNDRSLAFRAAARRQVTGARADATDRP